MQQNYFKMCSMRMYESTKQVRLPISLIEITIIKSIVEKCGKTWLNLYKFQCENEKLESRSILFAVPTILPNFLIFDSWIRHWKLQRGFVHTIQIFQTADFCLQTFLSDFFANLQKRKTETAATTNW